MKKFISTKEAIKHFGDPRKKTSRKDQALEAVSSILDDLRGLDGLIAEHFRRSLNLVSAAYSIMDEVYQKLENEK